MKKAFTVMCPNGIHARPARNIVEIANQYACSSYLIRNGKAYNAKSLVKMITLGARFGETIEVAAEGTDSREAVEAIGRVLLQKDGLH